MANCRTRPYNSAVNRTAIKHILLIAMLCYGQIVASVHVVGHFQLDDCHGVASSISQSCYAIDHHGEGFLFTATVHDHHSGHDHRSGDDHHSGDGDHAALDCAIYHALQSLNGVMFAAQSDLAILLLPVAVPVRTVSYQPTAGFNHRRIRAPPAIS